jgi:hypothetical protein
MQLCAEYHIRHSEFLSWDVDDQSQALAFAMEKAAYCQLCGTADWQWDEKVGGSRHAFEAVENFCHGCYHQSGAQTNDPNRNMDGITVGLSRTNTREAAQRMVRQQKRYLAGER